jgi:hypothetical protein
MECVQINRRRVVHDLRVVFAGEDMVGTTHIGGELIDLIDVPNDVGNQRLVTQIAVNELVGWRPGKLVQLQMDGPDPVSFLLQPFDGMSTDEATGTIDQHPFRSHQGRLLLSPP